MSNPNDHHYLPVFYLKRWTGADSRLVRFHRPYREVVASRPMPKSTGYEEGLYSLDGFQGGERQIIETEFFRPVDDKAAVILHELIDHGAGRLTGDQRSWWIRFIMSLQLRGPHSLTEIEALLNHSMEEVFARQSGDHDCTNPVPEDPAEFKNACKRLLPQLIDHPKLGQHVINMLWHVFDLSDAPFTLLTADRPFASSHGFRDARCILSVPLSPTHLFVAVNDEKRLEMLVRQRRRNTVRNANGLVVKLAVQNVYGASEDHLQFVENRLRRSDEPILPGVITIGLWESVGHSAPER